MVPFKSWCVGVIACVSSIAFSFALTSLFLREWLKPIECNNYYGCVLEIQLL